MSWEFKFSNAKTISEREFKCPVLFAEKKKKVNYHFLTVLHSFIFMIFMRVYLNVAKFLFIIIIIILDNSSDIILIALIVMLISRKKIPYNGKCFIPDHLNNRQ